MPYFNNAWDDVLAGETSAPYFEAIMTALDELYARLAVYPPRDLIFRALALTPPEAVKCVIVGQDPYHGTGQAHGLCFSVPETVPAPPSLQNIFKELRGDLGVLPANGGNLTAWAEQGVLLLNTILTVEAGKPMSHAGLGWQQFTDAVLRHLNARPQPIVYFLWGAPAQRKAELLDNPAQKVLMSAHPSPLSAHRGFFGSRPFRQVPDIVWGVPAPPSARAPEMSAPAPHDMMSFEDYGTAGRKKPADELLSFEQ